MHGYRDTSILNNPKTLPNRSCSVGGCCAWLCKAVSNQSVHSSLEKCYMSRLWYSGSFHNVSAWTISAKHIPLLSSCFSSVLEELLCSTPQPALRLFYKWKLLKGFVATSLSLLCQMIGVGAFLVPMEALWDGGRRVTVWAASSRGKWYTHASQRAPCCRCAEQAAGMSGLVFAELKFHPPPHQPASFPLPAQILI